MVAHNNFIFSKNNEILEYHKLNFMLHKIEQELIEYGKLKEKYIDFNDIKLMSKMEEVIDALLLKHNEVNQKINNIRQNDFI